MESMHMYQEPYHHHTADQIYYSTDEHQLHQQQHYLQMQQQNELERIRLVQQQAAFQQQRALLHQQMMYYEQQQQQYDHHHHHQQHHHQQQQQYEHDAFDLLNGATHGEAPLSPSSSGGGSGGGGGGDKAQRRAEHNAIERARRESLNTKFQQLAHSLPNLHNDRRPSKGTIIERTLEYVKLTVEKEEGLKTEIEQLRLANESLISKMTTTHAVIEEEDEDEDEGATPECEDNFSSRSSVTSNSSHYYPQQDFLHAFDKFQQDPSTLVGLNKDYF